MVWSRQDEPAAMTSRKACGGSGGSRGAACTINESRAQCQYMMSMRQVSSFEGLRGTRLVCTTRSINGAQ